MGKGVDDQPRNTRRGRSGEEPNEGHSGPPRAGSSRVCMKNAGNKDEEINRGRALQSCATRDGRRKVQHPLSARGRTMRIDGRDFWSGLVPLLRNRSLGAKAAHQTKTGNRF